MLMNDNFPVDGKFRRMMREENEARAHLTEEHTFTPAIKDYVPDYSLLV